MFTELVSLSLSVLIRCIGKFPARKEGGLCTGWYRLVCNIWFIFLVITDYEAIMLHSVHIVFKVITTSKLANTEQRSAHVGSGVHRSDFFPP